MPPINESHVEADAAWALYEAWCKIQTGEVDTALVYGFGKSSAGNLRRTLALQLDPYTLAPLWPDSIAVAGLQARLGIDAGLVERAADGRGRRAQPRATPRPTPHAQVTGSKDVDELLAEQYLADPLRRHDCAPITDGAAVIVLAADDRARELVERPAWITGIAHRVDSAHLGASRPDALAVDRRRRARRRASTASRSPSSTRRSPTRSCCCAASSASATTCGSPRPAARWPATRCSPAASSASARPRGT